MDITRVAQKLLDELKEEVLVHKGMQEGVALLHARLKQAIDAEKAAMEAKDADGSETKQ